MHHIFVNQNNVNLIENIIKINIKNDSYNYNHLVKSLRINIGELVLCSVIPFNFSFDYLCKVHNINNNEVLLSINEKCEANELPIKINLYQCITKSDKFEFIIEKAVELGVYSITPINSQYSIAKIDENDTKKLDKKIERFNKIATSASEQSKRNIIPKINYPMKYTKLIDMLKQSNDYNILFYENANGINNTRKYLEKISSELKENLNHKTNIHIEKEDTPSINVIIGPEGGFSSEEIEYTYNTNVNILSLGKRILRTETASITALSIIMYVFDDIKGTSKNSDC